MWRKAHITRRDLALACLLVTLAALLALPNLGSTSLWEDEANTANVAVNVLKTGLPLASDGRNLVSILPGHADIRDGLYIWQPWLPNYLAAGSMAVFGVDSFGARLPFALLFLVLVAQSYLFFRKLAAGAQTVAPIAALLVATSIPLLLHARQCRYYVLVPLLNLLITDRYFRFEAEPRLRHVVMLSVWFFALFNSFAPGAVLIGLTLGAVAVAKRPDRAKMKLLLAGFSLCVLSNLPLFVYTRMWDRQFGVQPGYSDASVFAMYLLRYLLTINNYFFPLAVMVAALVVCRRRIDWRGIHRNLDGTKVLVLICLAQTVGFSLLSDYPFTRYLVGIAPFIAYLGAKSIVAATGERRWLSLGLACAVIATNVLSVLPLQPLGSTPLAGTAWTAAGINGEFIDPDNVGYSFARGEVSLLLASKPSVPMANYLEGLLHPPRGPVDFIVALLREKAGPNDVVKISYEDQPLMFHTKLAITSATEVGPAAPQWIIRRHFNPGLTVDDPFVAVTESYHYSTIELPVGDVQWNNQPDPLYHFYETPGSGQAPPVTVLHRESGR
jgi:4-amino-4-deoxy-L-arabinose transferase-like glycosyltransferase